ncbi:MAG: ribosome maturation factor RimM [Defluviitaleaceae bacterium]|nr:ribosome maturation factor RimM [Defluviitaleaceae bacterium]
MNDYFRIGVIANTHALKGELRVLPTTDDPGRFDGMSGITVIRGDVSKSTTYEIERVWHNKGMVILKLLGIDDIDAAARLKGGEIIVSREDALTLEEGEYYWSDLLGLRVVTDEGEELGHIADILDTGANHVYSVSREGDKPILIPAIKQCILDVDIDGGVMTVHLLKGLR